MPAINNYAMPPVVKNLLILNVLFFVATTFLPSGVADTISGYGALHFWKGGGFLPTQLVTYMFLHADISHLFFNMFALWMFGRVIEADLGSRRFLLYYLVCGVGAGLVQLGANWIDFNSAIGAGMTDPRYVYAMANASTIGASGAVFGILLAFGVLHANSIMMLIFPPVRLKAKYMVMIYGAIELFAGIRGGGNVAHFAHLGGMVFGLLLILWWRNRRKIYF